MSNDNTISRRKAVVSMGAVLATTIVSPALAEGLTNADITSETAPEDPTTKYARPPFKEQTQPWPGLVSKMDPRPDHGEKSYKGSGRLKGRKALITGATPVWVGQQPLPMHAKVPMWLSIITLRKKRMLKK